MLFSIKETYKGKWKHLTRGGSCLAANENDYRFSTKPFDATSECYYYGYRYYDPEPGRWLNRDPIGEDGGVNVYAFVGNNGVNSYDILGQKKPCSEYAKTRGSGSSAKGRTSEQNKPANPNGCTLAPDQPSIFFSFRPACDAHDICYQTCGSNRETCDSSFRSDLFDICSAFRSIRVIYAECIAKASIYYAAVAIAGGIAFESQQDDKCKWESCCE